MDTCHGNSPSPKRCGSSHKQEGAQTLFIPPPNLVLEAYETLPMTSPMISWMVDMCALCFQSSIMQGENWPAGYNKFPKRVLPVSTKSQFLTVPKSKRELPAITTNISKMRTWPS